MDYKISLAGDLGSGKSTVSKIIIKETGAEYYSTGAIVRSIAERRGMSVVELNVYMETHPEIDHEIDDGLCALSDHAGSMIIDSRMAWHFVRGTYSVYLTTDLYVAAARVLGDHRATERVESLDDAAAKLTARRESEKKRYYEQYGVDIMDFGNYDLVLDTTDVPPETVAEVILAACARRMEGNGEKECYLCPTRLRYFDESDADAVSAAAEALERGEAAGPIEVFAKDGNFYVRSGNDAALAYSLTDAPLIPVRLVPYAGEDVGEGYVSMSDSL